MGADPWGHSLKLLMGAVVAGGAVVLGIMQYMQKQVTKIMDANLCISFV